MNRIIQWIKENKKISITILILFLLIITKPSRNEFKNYLGQKDDEGLKNKANYFFFSLFAKEDFDFINGQLIENDNIYLGIAGNFFHLPKHTIDSSSIPKNLSYESGTVIYEAVDSVSSSPGTFDEYGVPIIRKSWWEQAIDKIKFVSLTDADEETHDPFAEFGGSQLQSNQPPSGSSNPKYKYDEDGLIIGLADSADTSPSQPH